MRYLHVVLLVSLLILGRSSHAENTLADRETVLDRIPHNESEIVLDVPEVEPLCESVPSRKAHLAVNGCTIYCEREGNGTPVVVMHGGPGATHHYFHPAFSQAAAFAEIIYYDQRGCGQSEYDAGEGYSIQQAAADLEGLRNTLGIERWVVLGHSYGGTLAQCYTTRYPESVLGLVLVGSATYGLGIENESRAYAYLSDAEIETIREIRANPALTPVQALFNAHRAGDWKRQNYYRPSDTQLALMARYEWVQDPNMRRGVSQSLAKLAMEGFFLDCPIPTLIMEGEWDLTWDAGKAARFHACFPNATLVQFEHSGHNPFDDEPEKFMATLSSFITALHPASAESIATWKSAMNTRREHSLKSMRGVLKQSGWGRASSLQIAACYSENALAELESAFERLRVGFALYDAKRYDDALIVFETMQAEAQEASNAAAIAMIWQGHMLDLLQRRDAALERYETVVALKIKGRIQHDQYGLAYKFVPYARKRLKEPFKRLENSLED